MNLSFDNKESFKESGRSHGFDPASDLDLRILGELQGGGSHERRSSSHVQTYTIAGGSQERLWGPKTLLGEVPNEESGNLGPLQAKEKGVIL